MTQPARVWMSGAELMLLFRCKIVGIIHIFMPKDIAVVTLGTTISFVSCLSHLVKHEKIEDAQTRQWSSVHLALPPAIIINFHLSKLKRFEAEERHNPGGISISKIKSGFSGFISTVVVEEDWVAVSECFH